MRKTLLVSTTAVASLLVLSACGSYGGSNAASSPAAGNIHVASTSLGKVLVDGDGHTLYRLTADSPGHSTCGSQCLAYWPAVAPASSTRLPDVKAELGALLRLAESQPRRSVAGRSTPSSRTAPPVT